MALLVWLERWTIGCGSGLVEEGRGDCRGTKNGGGVEASPRSSLKSCDSWRGNTSDAGFTGSGLSVPAVARRAGGLNPTVTASRWARRGESGRGELLVELGLDRKWGVRRRAL